MPQTQYKLDIVRRTIVICFCKLYNQYLKNNTKLHFMITQAIDNNRLLIGCDIPNEELVRRLKTAIWESTCNPKEYPYEVWDLPAIPRNDFYERKRKFIKGIADELGI